MAEVRQSGSRSQSGLLASGRSSSSAGATRPHPHELFRWPILGAQDILLERCRSICICRTSRSSAPGSPAIIPAATNRPASAVRQSCAEEQRQSQSCACNCSGGALTSNGCTPLNASRVPRVRISTRRRNGSSAEEDMAREIPPRRSRRWRSGSGACGRGGPYRRIIFSVESTAARRKRATARTSVPRHFARRLSRSFVADHRLGAAV